jgi:hypothetical protein
MLPVMNFPHRQIRQPAIRMRHQMQPRLTRESKLQVDIFQMIPHQLRDLRLPSTSGMNFRFTFSFFMPSTVFAWSSGFCLYTIVPSATRSSS